MAQINVCEGIWLQFVKVKWPTIVIGSEEYNHRRKAFYAGMLSMLGIVQKTPNSVLDQIIVHVAQVTKSELKRGEAEIISPSKLKLN